MLEALRYQFFQNALIAGALISIACGIVGTLVVVNRVVFLAGGISHAAYGGIGLSYFLKIPILLGTTVFSLLSSLGIGLIAFRKKQHTDVAIGILWAFGMALGIIFIDLSPGYAVDLMSYLFGSILTISKQDLLFMSLLDLLIIVSVYFYYKDLLIISYDEEFAFSQGVKVKKIFLILMLLLGLSIVMMIQAVGLILVIALISIPAYLSEKGSNSLFIMFIKSSLYSFLFIFVGLFLSYYFNLTSGAAIVMVSALAFFLLKIKDFAAVKLAKKV